MKFLFVLALLSTNAMADTLWCRGGIGAGLPSPTLSTYIVTTFNNGQPAGNMQYLKFNRLKQAVRGAADVPAGFCALSSRAMTDSDPAILVFDKPLLNYSVSYENPNQAFFQTKLKTKILSKDVVLTLNISSQNGSFYRTDSADFQ